MTESGQLSKYNARFQFAGRITSRGQRVWEPALRRHRPRTPQLGFARTLRFIGSLTENNMDVRSLNGTMQTFSEVTSAKPWVGKMVMAAYANDPQGFADARRGAILAAKQMGKANPEAYVAQAYDDSNPLRVVFKTLPSQVEYQKMLGSMDANGQAAVSAALRNFQHYGQQIGATASVFGRANVAKLPPALPTDEVLQSMMLRNGLTPTTVRLVALNK